MCVPLALAANSRLTVVTEVFKLSTVQTTIHGYLIILKLAELQLIQTHVSKMVVEFVTEVFVNTSRIDIVESLGHKVLTLEHWLLVLLPVS